MNNEGRVAEIKLEKSKLRLLKLLNNKGISKFTSEGEALFVERHKFSILLLEILDANDLIEVQSNELKINENGRAYLKRSLFPEIPYTAQKLDLKYRSVIFGKENVTALHDISESPLARLYLRKNKQGASWLDEYQFSAGERLRSDFEKAQLQPNISSNWEASVASSSRGDGSVDISDFAIDARRRVQNAISVLGPDLSGIVLDVCCFLKGLETIEREKGWPPRSAKLLLRTALSSLSRHYGMGQYNNSTVNSHWADADNRPTITF